ncbi:MAG: hypothetical protein QXD25_00600 [Nanopusillaceae archaeon]
MTEFESFLKRKYWKEEEFRSGVEKAVRRAKKRKKIEKIPPKPEKRIEIYLKRFREILEEKDERKRKFKIKALKRFLYSRYIIKPENIPDEYFKNVLLGNFAERLGYTREQLNNPEIKKHVIEQFKIETGKDFETYQIPEEEKKQLQTQIINDQKISLDSWVDYFTSPEAENYPLAFKYWAFVEMLKLGSYDDKRKKFNKRTENTIAPFPTLNQQALSIVLDAIMKKTNEETTQILERLTSEQRKEFETNLEVENFNELYSMALEYVKSLKLPEQELAVIEGEWRIFPRDSDPKELVNAIKDFNTGWCIAGEATARFYLSKSNILIYFSKDSEGNYTIPRAAIVIDPDRREIIEVRGIAEGQNIDQYISPVVEQKLKELPGGERWSKTTEHMKKLAEIYVKYINNLPLTREELRFIYEIDEPIKGFGQRKDPRIKKILSKRNKREDLSMIFDCLPDQISLTEEEALGGNIVYHYGDLYLGSLESAEGLELPEEVGGSLYLGSLESAEGLKLPEEIGGDLYLGSLKSAEGLKLPEEIGGDLYLGSLESAEGLKLPKKVGGSLDLRSLESAEGLELPEEVGGSLYLGSLESAEGLKLPEEIGGDLYLGSLKSAEGLKLPEEIGGSLDLRSLESAEGLKLPEEVGGSLYLGSLKSPKGLELPKKVGGSLDLRSLESAEGLKLPEEVGGDLYLGSLESAEGLELPKKVGGSLYLGSLKSAEGLKLPEEVGGDLYLGSLESAEGLELPKKVGGSLYLRSLESAEGLKLPEEVGGSLYLGSLKSPKGLELPKKVGGSLDLRSLESAEGLKLPEEVGGDLYLGSLKSAEGLELPKKVGGKVIFESSYITEEEVNELIKKYPNLNIVKIYDFYYDI